MTLVFETNPAELEKCRKEFLDCQYLQEITKRQLQEYTDNPDQHSVYYVTFADVFIRVWKRIMRHPEKVEILKRLDEEMNDALCMCFTGRLTRLVNVLSGFYPDIEIRIGTNEQISNIIIGLKRKYGNSETEKEKLKEEFVKEMKERDYDQETIDEWKSYLDD